MSWSRGKKSVTPKARITSNGEIRSASARKSAPMPPKPTPAGDVRKAELAAIKHGIAVVAKPVAEESSRRPLISAIEEYLTDVKLKEQINKPEN